MRSSSSNFAFWLTFFARTRPGTAMIRTSAMIATTIIISKSVMAECFFLLVTPSIERGSCQPGHYCRACFGLAAQGFSHAGNRKHDRQKPAPDLRAELGNYAKH